jgi:pimeloyl-ACP methyl ester carboxylesterase
LRRTVLILTLLLLSAAHTLADSPHPIASPSPEGVVFAVDGSGCLREMGCDLTRAVADAGLPLCVETFTWSHGRGRVLSDLRHRSRHATKGEELAAAILARRHACPGGRIVVVAHSSGAAVVLAAAECLPACAIDRIILLAPAVSCRRDLGPALCVSREGIDSFYSHKDWTSLSLAVTGTADGWGHTSAGRLGFEATACAECSRLRQYPWDASMSKFGHTGGHWSCTRFEFLRAYVVPLLACDETEPGH